MGLVAFFAFSSGLPDGLEKVMEENGVEEGEQVYTAPLNYGEDYASAFLAGVIGFVIVSGVVLIYMRAIRSRKGN